MCARKTFYIFVSASDGEQFCAVRQDQPIPSLLDGVRWTYVGCIDITRDRPYGFDADAAHAAMRSRGVYFYRRELMFRRANFLLEAA
ncbi:hypothetical protein ABID82_001110 [Methylobacterium sp. PvP062]|jgi:hypothetical protein|uniref:Uncharacterized protein n=2 Tax=Methylobacterium radiotolerans TaxID=31998 RepID=B1LSX1_METRJ|nr:MULTISPECIES: hypothetical protein [Methylobacterium]MCX7334922.1 hypothetical protein [Hyphomicrobiales bacterium]GAN49726.1 hypothetical protein ME121_3759 [Methylobacterium sp. ME121]ACB26842.1 hypothetical protein Mrad2831_4882 [Methylobacterium radiotolerans JCM 2831]KTS12000.1 hypothetical protein SB3_02845 [Methylobacterium radiotolerans]KTS50659.1 hypothetical protein SB2_02245 [Methylobacterium radiotolerans]